MSKKDIKYREDCEGIKKAQSSDIGCDLVQLTLSLAEVLG